MSLKIIFGERNQTQKTNFYMILLYEIPESSNLQRQKVDQWLLWAEGGSVGEENNWSQGCFMEWWKDSKIRL